MSLEEYRERRYRSRKTREEMRLERNIAIGAFFTAVFCTILACMALKATLGV